MIRHKAWRAVVGLLSVALLVGALVPSVAADNPHPNITYPKFADPAFQRVWERYDRPVFYGQATRSYTWGAALTDGMNEPFKEGADGQHFVQYYEKSRMEINDRSADPNNPFFVTQGLLAEDMIYGRIQIGTTEFQPASPAQIPFGDPNDTTGPTYASFNGVINAPAVPAGQPITAAIDRAGNVNNSADSHGVTSMGIVPGTTTPHSIASVFYQYLTQSGLVYEGGQNTNAALYNPFFYVMGMPITEAYWAQVTAAGQPRTVLIQCFERRCLTYAPTNPQGFQVEMANTGLQYYNWRYPKTPADTTPPVLSNLQATDTTATSITISWTTDEPATSEVRYGKTAGDYPNLVGNTTLTTSHSITLTGLQPDNRYHFIFASTDAAGNRAQSGDNVFQTQAQTQAPQITDIKAAPADTSATITFTTDQAATAAVAYYTDPAMKTVVTSSEAAGTSHSITLNGLAPNTTYKYVIIASSASGQTTSPEQTFTTTAASPSPSPSASPSPSPSPSPAP